MTLDLDSLERLARKATPGRWKTIKSIHGPKCLCVQYGKDENYASCEMEPGDARFIAACNPQTVLELIRRLRESET